GLRREPSAPSFLPRIATSWPTSWPDILAGILPRHPAPASCPGILIVKMRTPPTGTATGASPTPLDLAQSRLPALTTGLDHWPRPLALIAGRDCWPDAGLAAALVVGWPGD